jgi:Mrr N-terminal domain
MMDIAEAPNLQDSLPPYWDLIWPMILLLRTKHSGEMTSRELQSELIKALDLTEAQWSITTENNANLFFCRSKRALACLHRQQFIYERTRGHWRLTDKGWDCFPFTASERRAVIREGPRDSVRRKMRQ